MAKKRWKILGVGILVAIFGAILLPNIDLPSPKKSESKEWGGPKVTKGGKLKWGMLEDHIREVKGKPDKYEEGEYGSAKMLYRNQQLNGYPVSVGCFLGPLFPMLKGVLYWYTPDFPTRTKHLRFFNNYIEKLENRYGESSYKSMADPKYKKQKWETEELTITAEFIDRRDSGRKIETKIKYKDD